MNFSDIKNIFPNRKIEIVQECEFDQIHLVGKPKLGNKRAISYIESMQYIEAFLLENLEGVICTRSIAKELEALYGGGICIDENPRDLLWMIHNYFTEMNQSKVPTVISDKADISERAVIAKHNVVIEDYVQVLDGAIIKENVHIKEESTIHENVVIGTSGFYYYGRQYDKKLVHSAGGVYIGKNVDIHPNTVIQKGVIGGNTVIGDNTKIDMLCKIGHDAQIANDCVITAGTTVSAGNKVGSNSFLGISSVTTPNISIGENVKISVGTVVGKDVPSNVQVINLKNFNNNNLVIR